jgi:thiol-disulfide isomerase/thioredoxin
LRIALLLGPLIALTLAGCDRQKPETSQGDVPRLQPPSTMPEASLPTGRLDRSYAGKAAPQVIFQDPAGEAVTLADFRGRPLLLNLWATWCAPCIVEMPSLDALAAREKGLTVLAVSQDFNGEEKVDAFFAGRGFKRLEPYLDPELLIMTELRLGTLPTSILYDAEGNEVWRMTGREDWTGTRAASLLKEAAKE